MGLFDGETTTLLGTAAAIGIGASTGGWALAATMGLSAYASLSAGEARASSLEEQMRLGMLSAEEALLRGRHNANLTIQQGKQVVGQQKAGYAGMGVSTLVGSPLEQSNQSLLNAHLESKRILAEADFAANMRRQGALAYGAEAQRERTSSLLTTVAGIGSQAYQTYSYTEAKNAKYKTNADSSLLGSS